MLLIMSWLAWPDIWKVPFIFEFVVYCFFLPYDNFANFVNLTFKIAKIVFFFICVTVTKISVDPSLWRAKCECDGPTPIWISLTCKLLDQTCHARARAWPFTQIQENIRGTFGLAKSNKIRRALCALDLLPREAGGASRGSRSSARLIQQVAWCALLNVGIVWNSMQGSRAARPSRRGLREAALFRPGHAFEQTTRARGERVRRARRLLKSQAKPCVAGQARPH